jgi:hypothetical protein
MRIGALLLATGLLNVTNLSAQQPSASPQDQVSAAANSVLDSTVPKPKSKGGLFGKAKKLARSKVVQTVAKTAACTMVPGGQAIARAIDAASSKSAGEAAQGAAGVASASSCLPGIGAGLGAGMAKGMAGASQAMLTGMPMSGQISAQMAANTQVATEAPGYAPVVGADLVAELKKGKTAVRDIDWVAGGAKISEAGTTAFVVAMTQIGKAMAQAGGRYQIDIYLDQRYGDAELKILGPSRIAAVREELQQAAGGSVPVKAGKAKQDKNPRLEIVRAGR